MFTQRPEEPTEWAGLPAEPLRPVNPAEYLDDAGALGVDPGFGLAPASPAGHDADGISSITIPFEPLADDDPQDTQEPESGLGLI